MKFTPLLYFLFLFLLTSCEEKEDLSLNDIQASDNTSISFSPADTFWFLRRQADSIEIRLLNGTTPYSIEEDFDFAGISKISNDLLTIYPNQDPFSGNYGFDFLRIKDNSGNINSFNVEVRNLTRSYRNLDSISVEVSGDTAFTIKKDFRRFSSFWDRYENAFQFSLLDVERNNFALRFKTSNNPGINVLSTEEEVIYLSKANTHSYILKDSSQTIEIVELTTSSAEIRFIVEMKNNNLFTPNPGNYLVNGYLKVSD